MTDCGGFNADSVFVFARQHYSICFASKQLLPSPQGDIEQHHQCEPEGGTDGADIAVLIGPRLGDKFFDDNIDHCTGGESEDIGQHGCYERGYKDGQYCADRLGNTGEGSAGKGFAFRGSACGEGAEIIAPSGKF